MAKAVARVPGTAIEMFGSQYQNLNDVWVRCKQDHDGMPVFRNQLLCLHIYYRRGAWVMTDVDPTAEPIEGRVRHASGILRCPQCATPMERMDALQTGVWELDPFAVTMYPWVKIVALGDSSVRVMDSYKNPAFSKHHPNLDGTYEKHDGGYINRELGIRIDDGERRSDTYAIFTRIANPQERILLRARGTPLTDNWHRWSYLLPKKPDPHCRVRLLLEPPA